MSDQIMQGALNARKNNPPSSSASSDGNDEAAMAVIMSLLEVRVPLADFPAVFFSFVMEHKLKSKYR